MARLMQRKRRAADSKPR